MVIIGCAEMAVEEVEPASRVHNFLLNILNAGKGSADLTSQLLAFARKQIVLPQVLDLNETISGMLKMLKRLIGEDINLAWAPGQGLWRVRIDPTQVDQVLANLMVNARDAIHGTGKITIETCNKRCDEAYLFYGPDFVPGEYVMLAVSDDGSGMDKKTMTNIFEPFFTTKQESKGTGLGLATVYGIIKQNGGFINVYSKPGRGSTFKIYLPRRKEDLTAALEEAGTEVLGGTETILVVEDEEEVLDLCRSVLEGLGYKILTTGQPDEAIRLAGEYADGIDLLLTDVIMPGMNGKELWQRISSIRPALKCLYMSGYTADVIARQGVLDQGIQFIQKPFSRSGLATKIREALQ